MEEFVELPSDGRIINKRYIHNFDPKRLNRLNYSNGAYELLKDERDARAVKEALTSRPQVVRQPRRTPKKKNLTNTASPK